MVLLLHGPITEMVKRPLSFVHIEPHKTLVVLQKGQVRIVSYGFRAGEARTKLCAQSCRANDWVN